MSFSFHTVSDNNRSAIRDAIVEKINADPNCANAKSLDIFSDVIAFAQYVAEATCRPEDQVSISVYGHANPSTDPVVGWANNSVTVGVTQIVKK